MLVQVLLSTMQQKVSVEVTITGETKVVLVQEQTDYQSPAQYVKPQQAGSLEELEARVKV